MCVTVAMKLPRDRKTGKPTKDAKWRLAKIRDRIYDPEYKVKRYTVKEHGVAQLFLVDIETDWTEGLSVHPDGHYFSIVNSALNNSADKKDGKSKGKSVEGSVSANGKTIRKALKSHDIEAAVEILKDGKLDGCNLITDGDRLFVLESTLPVSVKNKYRSKKKPGQKFEEIVPASEYVTIVKEIKDDYLVVRTNTGVFDETMGYQPEEGIKYESSIKRREYAKAILEKNAFEPLDLIGQLARMGRDDIDENPFFRPIRLKKYCEKIDVGIYSSSIIQTDPSGTMIVKPIECTFDIKNTQALISDKYLAHMVILPHRSRMFESFKELVTLYDLKKTLA